MEFNNFIGLFFYFGGKLGSKFSRILGRTQVLHTFFGYPVCIKHAFIRTHTRISHNIFFYCYIRTHDVHSLHFVHLAKHKIIMFDFFVSSTIVVASRSDIPAEWTDFYLEFIKKYRVIQIYVAYYGRKTRYWLTSENTLLTKCNLIE